MISCIIPAYNAEPFLAEAIRSALSQNTFTEVIVVDDGSTDQTAEVARRFSPDVQLVQQPHGGIGAARNHGTEEACGDYLAFLDADDLWVPGKLQAQLDVLQASTADMVFGNIAQFRVREGKMLFEGDPAAGKLAGAMLIRRSSWAKTHGFSNEWRVGEFVDWYLKATEAGLTSRTLEMTVLFRRLHENNTGANGYGRSDYVSIIKQALDRRRTAMYSGE